MRERRRSRRELLRDAAGMAGIAGLGVTAAGCGAGQGELGDGTGNLTMWTWPDNDRVLNEYILPIFHKQFPEIKVKVQGFNAGGYSPKLLGALVSGKGPDIAMVEISWISNFHSKPGFVDLSKPPFNANQFAKNYIDFSWDYISGGHTGITQLPKNPAPGGMFYRRSVMKKAGLPSDPAELHDATKTWDEYFKIGKKIIKPGEQWLLDEPGYMVNVMRGQQGASYFDSDGNPLLDGDLTMEAVSLIPDLKRRGLLAPLMSEQERGAAIGSGSVATFFSGNWFGGWLKGTYAEASSGDWGVALAPEINGVSAFNYGGDFVGIIANSKKQRAAWTFITWFTQNSKSLQALYSQDLYPGWLPALDDPWLNKPDKFYGGQNVNEVFEAVSKEMQAPRTNPNDGLAKAALGAAIDNVHSEVLSPRAALKKAQTQVEWKMV